MIGQMRGGLHHAAGGAGWAHAPALAGVGDQEVVPARSAADMAGLLQKWH